MKKLDIQVRSTKLVVQEYELQRACHAVFHLKNHCRRRHFYLFNCYKQYGHTLVILV